MNTGPPPGELWMMERPVAIERLAVVAALVTLVAAVVLLIIGLIQNWAGVVLGLIGLFLLVTSGWAVVARRGAARTAGLVVALASVGLLIWALVLSRPSLLWIIVIIVLAAASVGCARVALRGAARGREQARAAQPVKRARHPVLIMNPKSGGGKVERFHLVDECH